MTDSAHTEEADVHLPPIGDDGRELQFGLFLPPETAELDQTLSAARAADEAGLELIGIQDHPHQKKFLDTCVLMATVLANTEQVHVFPDVASLPLRPPAVLAKTASSLDVISNGRFELGLGAGSFWEAITAMGGPTRSGTEAAEALTEALDVVHIMWSTDRSVRYSGKHYRLPGVHPGPRPAHDMGIWLGVVCVGRYHRRPPTRRVRGSGRPVDRDTDQPCARRGHDRVQVRVRCRGRRAWPVGDRRRTGGPSSPPTGIHRPVQQFDMRSFRCRQSLQTP